jgi:Holliday junction DNA helicase RuvA
VREEHIHLYGFGAARERDWFTLLQTVQGVGARVALGLLSVLGPEDLAQAIAARDRVPLTRANGIGPKVANRILAELKDKMSETPLEPSAQYVGFESTDDGNISADAISVLVNLGYGRSEAFRAIGVASRVLADDGDLQSLIRAGLKELG